MIVLLARITIPGHPRAKGRPRFSRGHAYTPEPTRAYEALIGAVWDAESRPDQPLCVRLDIDIYLGTKRHVDASNIAKAIEDGLNKRAYDDDWRIHDLRVQKYYTTPARARTEVTVYAIEPDRDERV